MDDDENTELIEMDPEVDTDKKARRSSILKPQKPRNPLSTLDFSEANPDNTLSRATRRVSFASSNFVKPFAADPEKNTIWDTTYEEEVNHTDSTKNSTDQTQGTRTDFLNTTSIHSVTTDLRQSEINPFAVLSVSEGIGIDIIKDQTVSDVNPGESLVSFARKLRSKSMEQYDVQTMDFTLLNKTAEVKINNVSCTTTKLTERTMELTCLTDKENVNPLINDLSLVIPRGSCLEATNATKYFVEEDMDCTKSVKSIEEEINKKDVMVNTRKRESVMDFTCLTNEQNEDFDLEKQNDRQQDTEEDIKSKTIYHDDSANAMELTSVNKEEFPANKSRRRTIFFNAAETEGNMDFTFVDTNDDVNIKENILARTGPPSETRAKNKTIIFNQSDNDMQFTTSFPLKIQNDIKTKEETLRFDNSGEEMEFTNTFAIQKNAKTESKSKTICFDKSECNMEFTTTLVGAIDAVGNSTIAQADDMEITTAEAIEKKSELPSEMELTSILQTDSNITNQWDMSLTKNLCMPARFDDVKKLQVNFDATGRSDTDTVKDSVEPNPTCDNKSKTKENPSSNSLLSVKDSSALPSSSNVPEISSNNTVADHQGTGNDISSCNVSKTNDIKRHILDSTDPDVSKKRRIQQSLTFNDNSGVDNNVPLESNKLDQSASPTIEQGDLQVSDPSSSNVLYTEPMKHQLKKAPVADLSANLHLDGSLNLHQISTPAMSFHMNLSSMSPCIEDTQQLIHATFSKPETLKILNKAAESSFDKPEDPREGLNDSHDFIKRSNETLNDNKSCFLEDITPLALVAEDFDNSANEPDKIKEREDLETSSSSNVGNYTFRSQTVLANIEKHLLVYEPLTPQRNMNLPRLTKQFHENCRLISEFLKSAVPPVDLETRRKQDMENSQSSVSDAVLSTSEDSGVPPALQLIAPKSLQERINEIAKRSKRFWKVRKFDGDYCYFYTLFETMSFKVDIHPELGVVYSIETFSNLSDLSQPLCHYQFKLLQQKLKWDNLSSVLGHNFDVFALLDYVYMSVEEIVNFHLEYLKLVEKYGKSHHFRMNPDFSVTFEILNIKQIICWIITIKLPMTSQIVVMREDVKAVQKVGKIVNEEHIRTIAENSAKGLNFLRNFIENVDDYVTRMGKRLK